MFIKQRIFFTDLSLILNFYTNFQKILFELIQKMYIKMYIKMSQLCELIISYRNIRALSQK